MGALIDVVVPVFAIVALGYGAGVFRVLGPDSAAALNRFVYYFALPPVLFVFPARQPFDQVLHGPFIAAFLAGAGVTLLVVLLVNRLWFRHEVGPLALHSIAAIYPNTSYMGVPLFLTAFGTDGAMPAIIATMVGITLFVGAAIAILEAGRAKGPSPLRIAREVAGTLCRNPLLIASALGVAMSALEWPVPAPVGNFLDLMASAAGPAALFALGLSLVGRKLLGDMPEVAWTVFLKLAVQPAATWAVVVWLLPMEPEWATAAVLLSALPTGAIAFVIAQQYDVYLRRTSSAIVLSTLFSLLTVSGLLIALDVG